MDVDPRIRALSSLRAFGRLCPQEEAGPLWLHCWALCWSVMAPTNNTKCVNHYVLLNIMRKVLYCAILRKKKLSPKNRAVSWSEW